jgi:quinol monooxygenase YgiN
MVQLFIKHKVADYNTWKATFDAFVDTRRAGGEKSFQIFHPDNEPNNLFLIFEWDNLENAHSFLASEELKNAMKQAGVIEEPQIHFLNELDKGVL